MLRVRVRLVSLLTVGSVAVVSAGLFVVGGASAKSGGSSVGRGARKRFE